ncbi:uncharacterized protein LOC143056158 [Mytilus galloprovincialis]|uniref:uncharacterized protein LOC143056158 n=1 Tax=Mytilus galloprovincialis TaxID=29158 RepID=UPI003F7BD644
MIDTEEYLTIRNDASNNQALYGFVPKVSGIGRVYQVHLCHYHHADTNCGAIYQLNSSNPVVHIATPNFPGPYVARQRCNFIFKGPKDSKLILNFHTFNVEVGDSGECVSTVGIRSALPGQPEIKYCGDDFKRSVMTDMNFLGITFTSGNNNQLLTGFNATISLIRDRDMCYNGNGTTYNGNVNVTKKFQTCLHWSKVTHCVNNLYQRSESASFLKENFCRRAGDGLAPWCYTDEDQCSRDYCDVCNLEKCYDIFDDCNDLMTEDKKFCSEDIEASRGCRKSCKLCSFEKPLPVKRVSCTSPLIPFDGIPKVPLKTSYAVGETVLFMCINGVETDTHVCLADGTWSGGNFVCGKCPPGWITYSERCYKWFDVYMTVYEGRELCANMSASMSSAKDLEENDFLLTLSDNSRSFWLGIEKDENDEYIWKEDGSIVTWTNWGRGNDTSNACANVNDEGKWNRWGCDWDYLSIICKLTPSNRVECLDYRLDCLDLLKDDPGMCIDFEEFARDNCPWTCGFCGSATICAVPTLQPKTIMKAGSALRTRVGGIFSYDCVEGYELDSGNDKRACLRDGSLTGDPPVCIETHLVQSRNNEVSLRSRRMLANERKMYIGNSKSMRIHKSGRVVAWTFYSMVDCEVTFSIWRPVDKGRFTLIGRNTIDKSRHDRKRQVNIPFGEQISALKGDIMGVFFAYGKGSCIPYDLCNLNMDKYGNQMESMNMKGKAVVWNIKETYQFKTLTDSSRCKIWSFSAVVQ